MTALERHQAAVTSLGSACAGRRATVDATTAVAWPVMLAIPYDWRHAWRASSCASATLRAISLGRYPAVRSEAHDSYPMTRLRARARTARKYPHEALARARVEVRKLMELAMMDADDGATRRSPWAS